MASEVLKPTSGASTPTSGLRKVSSRPSITDSRGSESDLRSVGSDFWGNDHLLPGNGRRGVSDWNGNGSTEQLPPGPFPRCTGQRIHVRAAQLLTEPAFRRTERSKPLLVVRLKLRVGRTQGFSWGDNAPRGGLSPATRGAMSEPAFGSWRPESPDPAVETRGPRKLALIPEGCGKGGAAVKRFWDSSEFLPDLMPAKSGS